jgi:hypothetical protein
MSKSERAMAAEWAIAADESSVTLERHVSMASPGTGNWNVGTRGVLAGEGAVASSVRTGSNLSPMTPPRSTKEDERVIVFPVWCERRRGFQMVR